MPSIHSYTHVPENLQPSVKCFFRLSVLHRTPSVSEQGINQSASTDLSSTIKSNSLAGWRPLRCVGTSKCLFLRTFSIILQSVLITSWLSTCTLFQFPYKCWLFGGSCNFIYFSTISRTTQKKPKQTVVRYNWKKVLCVFCDSMLYNTLGCPPRWQSLWRRCTEFIYASCSDTALPKSVSISSFPSTVRAVAIHCRPSPLISWEYQDTERAR